MPLARMPQVRRRVVMKPQLRSLELDRVRRNERPDHVLGSCSLGQLLELRRDRAALRHDLRYQLMVPDGALLRLFRRLCGKLRSFQRQFGLPTQPWSMGK